LSLEGLRETPAYAFARGKPLAPLPSKQWHYRVQVPLTRTPLQVLTMDSIHLKKGRYRIVLRGSSDQPSDVQWGLVLHVLGRRVEHAELPYVGENSFALVHPFEVEKAGYIDLHVTAWGEGSPILDTVQIVPGH
jgi:hypothetical protein